MFARLLASAQYVTGWNLDVMHQKIHHHSQNFAQRSVFLSAMSEWTFQDHCTSRRERRWGRSISHCTLVLSAVLFIWTWCWIYQRTHSCDVSNASLPGLEFRSISRLTMPKPSSRHQSLWRPCLHSRKWLTHYQLAASSGASIWRRLLGRVASMKGLLEVSSPAWGRWLAMRGWPTKRCSQCCWR